MDSTLSSPNAAPEPAISELVVTSDGFVLAQREGDIGANELIGTRADLDRNLLTLVQAAGLTPREVWRFGELQRERIERYDEARLSVRAGASPK